MKKKIIILLLILFNMGYIHTMAYQSVSSTVNSATSFLQPRPGSSRTSLTLTLSQLNSFHTTVTSFVESAKVQMYDIDSDLIDARLDAVDVQLAGLTSAQFSANYQTYYDLYEELFAIYALAIESKVVEGRGMWHRPFERNLTQVQTTLQEMVDMGVNMLYVETFWLGRLIYPSNIPGTYQHGFTLAENYGEYGNNLLLAFVEEGKKMGIEVHAWVENFFVGYGTSYLDSPILANKPQWASYNYDGTIPQRSEVNYIFMDPANPEVRHYLKEIYAEIIQTTDVASIHLDYIRYPVAKNTTSTSIINNLDTGYSEYAEAEFKYQYGLTGDLRQLVVSNATIAAQWKAYKTQVISDFVAGVYYTVKNIDPSVSLSIAIFGNVENAINEKMQDWGSWTEDGYIEIIMPMSYYQSSLTVGTETKRLTDLVGKNAFSYAGIAPTYMGFNAHYNTTQIQAALSNGAQGTAFFASQFYMFSRNDYALSQKSYALEVQDVLTEGLFRNDAVLPHDDVSLVVSTQLNYTLDKATRIYMPRGSMTQANLDLMQIEFERIQSLPMVTESDLLAVINELKAFSPTQYSSGAGRTRILDDRNYLIKVLEIRYERYSIDQSIDITINPDPDHVTDPEQLAAPINVRYENSKLIWDAVDNASQYEITLNFNDQVYTFNSTIAEYTFNNLNVGTYSFSVRALGDGFFFTSSEQSQPFEKVIEPIYLEVPQNVTIESGVLSFDIVSNAVSYVVKINQDELIINDPFINLNQFNLQPGTYVISVKARGNGSSIIDSAFSETYTFVVERVFTEVEAEIDAIIKNDIRALILFLLTKE
jgi:uncharacterized lipoprotein YddW (UPF0748 family)